MSYVDQNVMPGEQVLYRTRMHWFGLVALALRIVFWVVLWFVVAPLILAYFAENLPASRTSAESLLFINWAITLLFGIVIVALLAAFVLQMTALFTTEFAVTDKRVLAKMGSLRVKTIELFLSQVEGIMVEQGILGRLMGYGTLVVTGTGGMKTPFPNIAHADEFRKQVRGHIMV